MKQEYNNLYDKISPLLSNDELLIKMLRKAENMDNKKKIGFKKPLTVIAAAVIALTATTATAAATGIIDFKTIFGDFVNVKNEDTANRLLSQPENVEWTTSDSNYEIKMNGVAGTESCVLMNFEIERTDGKPVTDFFINKPVDDYLEIIFNGVNVSFADGSVFDGKTIYQDWRFSVTESGNIQGYVILNTDADMNGATISCRGVNFYPDEKLINYELEHKVWRDFKDGKAFFHNHGLSDDSHSVVNPEILGLELEWTLDFTYNAAESGSATKEIIDCDKPLIINKQIPNKNNPWAHPDTPSIPVEMKILESSFSNINGRITAEYYETENMMIFKEDNECFLVTADGTELPVVINDYGGMANDSGYTQAYLNIVYTPDNSYELTVVDINTVTAIKINGTEFPIE